MPIETVDGMTESAFADPDEYVIALADLGQ